MNYIEFISELVYTFNDLKIEYMIIGGGSALLQGFNMMTKDIDIYPKKSKENCEKIIEALRILKFPLSEKNMLAILRGKDFVQLDEPYELDFVFSPDGFESYTEAENYKITLNHIPLLTIEGIIKSKQSANRPKDKAVIDLLIDFKKYLKEKNKNFSKTKLFEVPVGYKIADNQTLNRWKINEKLRFVDRLSKGLY